MSSQNRELSAHDRSSSRVNLGEKEGWASLIAGSGLVLYGLRGRRSLPLALLGGALTYRGLTRHCPVYQATGVDRSGESNERSVSVTIRRSPQEIYRFCSDMNNFPKFVSFLKETRPEEENHHRWSIEFPGGKRHDLRVELFEQTEPRVLRWRTLDDAPLRMQGSLEFEPAPANRGTRVRATADFGHNGGSGLLAGLVKPFAKHKLRHDLGRLKRLLEAGEELTVQGQPSGRGSEQPRSSFVDEIPGTQPIRNGPRPGAEAALHW